MTVEWMQMSGRDDDALRVTAVATTPVRLAGEQVIDGLTVDAGRLVLATNQHLSWENGLYVTDLGPWKRLDVPTSAHVRTDEGMVHAETTWTITDQ